MADWLCSEPGLAGAPVHGCRRRARQPGCGAAAAFILVAGALYPAAAAALSEAEILRRFEAYEERIEAYEKRIEALESEVRSLRGDEQPGTGSVAPATATADTVTGEELDRVEEQVRAINDELAEARSRLRLEGFATVGVARSSDNAAFQNNNAHIHDDYDFNADTVLGLQATFQVNPDVDFVTQVVARGVDESRDTDDFHLEVEWAYLKYRLDANTRLLLGRSRLPLFMHSEYLEVGYAYPWVRPPVEVYGLIGQFSSFDGATLRYSRLLPGSWVMDAQAYLGGHATDVVLAGSRTNVDLDRLAGGTLRMQKDDLGLFASLARTDTTLSPLPAALQAVETAFGLDLSVDDEEVTFAGLGYQYDNGRWMTMGEYTQVRIDGWLSDWDAWYLTGGYRWGQVMTHLTFSDISNTDNGDRVFLGGALNFRDPPFLIDSEQSSWTLGFRYDLGSGVALKGEWQHVYNFQGTAGLFSALPDDSVDIWSFVLDMMF